jgi:hypothetical protein
MGPTLALARQVLAPARLDLLEHWVEVVDLRLVAAQPVRSSASLLVVLYGSCPVLRSSSASRSRP